MKKLNLGFFAFFALCLAMSFTACKNTPAENAATTDVNAVPAPTVETTAPVPAEGAAQPTNATAAPAEGQPAAPAGPTTSIEFKELEYDYGTIKAGEKAVHVYKFKNTGKEPLIISDAKGSCGCTVPQWPKEPIAPGKEGEIKVEFDSKGKNGPQAKKVTLTANTNPAQTFLTIKGNVKGDPTAATPTATPAPK